MNMNKIVEFIKKEVVLVIALLLGLVSSFVIPPSAEYVSYIDYRVLVLLFALMLVVAGLKSLGVFRLLGEKMCQKVKSIKGLSFVLMCLCFFSSMLITNDVALITFVPFTISVFAMIDCEDRLIPVIVLETIAANLGSMLTPIGNPQNLLLFSVSGMSIGEFILLMLPLTVVSFVLIAIGIFFMKNQQIQLKNTEKQQTGLLRDWHFWMYCVLFVVCLGNVFHLYSHWIVLLIIIVAILATNRKLFTEVDYSLLFTFIGFFIFIGNMKQVEAVNTWLSQMITGREMLTGILASQVISNVPAAMLLSGFTTDYQELLYGVNIGGLGTLIASMASLISYRFFVKAYPQAKQKYFVQFTVYNVVLLVIITGLTMLFLC